MSDYLRFALLNWLKPWKELMTRTLCGHAWVWCLPLLLGLLPAWQAWFYTCAVPRADYWYVLGDPLLKWSEGGSLWEFIHGLGTDSRHDAPKLLHLAVIKWAHWNLWVESMICVSLGVLTAMMTVSFWRNHPSPILARWGMAWLTTFCVLSPVQWMNWVWGIQICYTLLVAASVATFWVLCRPWPLLVRSGVGGVCSLVAIFSFLNGWLTWCFGLVAILLAAKQERQRGGRWVSAVAVWVLAGIVAVWIYVLDWPEAKQVGEKGFFEILQSAPGSVVTFYLQVLGAPFSEWILYRDRADRHALQAWSAPLLSCLGLALLAYSSVACWRYRAELAWAKLSPWLLMISWGATNALAITIGRIGKDTFTPFQSRYPSYTVWFWIGVLGLLWCVRSRTAGWLRRGWLVIMLWGMAISAVLGWWDCIRAARQGDLLEAAVAMRHAFIEPVPIDGVRPMGEGAENVSKLDQLDQLGLLHVSRVPNERVSEAIVTPKGIYRGALTGGQVVKNGVILKGWALAETHTYAKAVAVSYEMPSQPERWLGLATHVKSENKKASKYKANVFENRIGWAYEPLTGAETCYMTWAPLRIKRPPLPSGKIKFRAYAFNPFNGQFSPLDGSVALIFP